MIVLSNTTVQTLLPGQSLIFDEVILHSGCGECYRKGTGTVKMRANGVYEADFTGNVTSSAAGAPVTLSMQISGATLPETRMTSTPSTAGNVNNVHATTLIKNCCGDYDRVSITNTGTNPVTVGANSAFVLRRVS